LLIEMGHKPQFQPARWVASTFFLAAIFMALSGPVLAEDGASNIVFVVKDYMNSGSVVSGTGREMKIKTLIEPFAFINHGMLTALPDEEKIDLKAFEKTYYQRDQAYKLIASGKDVGTVKVAATAFDIQCVSLAASASVTPSTTVSGMRMALATNADVQDLGLVRREATPAERAAFIKLAHDLYSRNGIKEAIAAKAEIQHLTVVEGGTGVILVGSAIATESVIQDTYDQNGKVAGTAPADVVSSVFIIAEKSAANSYQESYSWFNSGSDSGYESQDFVDILGLSSDNMPEIVSQFNYSESTEYHVYRKINGEWIDYFKNEGSGC